MFITKFLFSKYTNIITILKWKLFTKAFRDQAKRLWLDRQCLMEQRTLKNVNSCLNTDIYSYLVTPGG
jgi:hypothetical protein